MLLASRTRTVSCGPGEPPLIIGERINPTGRKQFGEKLLAGDMSMVGVEARSQKEAGATALDINVGVAGGDERAIMPMAVREAQMAGVPLVIDSSDPVALEEGLKYAPGRPLINSVNGEAARLEPVLALARKYGAAVVALCLDDEGIPDSAAKRTAVADLIEGRAAAHGLERNDLLFDFLTLSVASAQKQLPETLCAVRSARLAGRLTLLGSSNISFGLPARDAVNAAFIAMSVEAGLDAVIMNPMHGELVRSLGAASLLAGRDPGAQRYMPLFRAAKDRVLDSKAAAKTDILTRLGDSIIDGVGAAVVQMVAEALASGLKPMDISARGLMPGMAEVGRRFKSNDMFLPQVMMAAETMQAAMGRLELELKDGTAQSSPLVLIATVEGDIHDLGKGIVAALLKNGGFRVHDAGKGVPATKIVELATQMQPAVIGLSALMTTTMVRMKETVQALGEAGINTPVMLGGAVLTPEYAESIGAHYGADAVDAVELARKLAGFGDKCMRKFAASELVPGRSYRVITEFKDYDNIVHPVGMSWKFLKDSFLPYEDGLSLFVDADGRNLQIRLQWRPESQGQIIELFSDYVEEGIPKKNEISMSWLTTILSYVYWPLLYFAVYIPFIVPRLNHWQHIPFWITWPPIVGFIVVLVACGMKRSHKSILVRAFALALFLQGFIFVMSQLNMSGFLKAYEAGFLPDVVAPIIFFGITATIFGEAGRFAAKLRIKNQNKCQPNISKIQHIDITS
jgi:methylmalonyl-CoA mutase cobalamin-binding domain/chain